MLRARAVRGVKAPPSYAELSSLFGPLEQCAESCGIHEAGHFLRKGKMGFLAARAAKPPPSYAELSSLFGPLEQCAESCGIHEAGHFLRKAKMRFLAARAAKPARQSDIRSFTSS